MRVALLAHGLPPDAVTGVETHTAALAAALARAGVEVEVLAPRHLTGLADLAQRREERDGYGVTWLNLPSSPAARDVADAVDAFLDRERPDVVHFQHLLRLGLECVERVERRGLPSLYTAHDFYPAHDTYTLLRPDLTSFDCGDQESQARTDRALAFLERLPQLGDPHGTVLREQLGDASWDTLQAILRGERDSGLDAAREATRARAQAFREAFARFDARFATSRHLARQLGGALGRGLDFRPAGIELSRFAGCTPPRRGPQPLRFGFFGGLLKHKGVHLLLDAFEGLGPRAELHLHGDSGDRPYVDWVRRRAAEVGAVWHGRFQAERLPELLDDVDVVVVPSLWVENAPFVIREAFAARRPVIASDTEALRESVRDDEDGLLFRRGDEAALRAALDRLVDEDWLLDRLEMGIRAPLSVDTEARQYADTYAELVASRRASREEPVLPPSLEAFAERHRRLTALSTRELFDRVQRGLTRLGQRVGSEVPVEEFLAIAVGRGSRLRDDLVEERRARTWLRRTVDALTAARDELERRSTWYAERLEELEQRLAWTEEQVAGKDAALGSLERERDWLRETDRAHAEARGALEDELAEAGRARASLLQERDWLKGLVEAGAGQWQWVRERVADDQPPALDDATAVLQAFAALEQRIADLEAHEAWMRAELTTLTTALAREGRPGPEVETLTPEAVPAALSASRMELVRIVDELNWRREEMHAAGEATHTLLGRLTGKPLRERAREWQRSDVPHPQDAGHGGAYGAPPGGARTEPRTVEDGAFQPGVAPAQGEAGSPEPAAPGTFAAGEPLPHEDRHEPASDPAAPPAPRAYPNLPARVQPAPPAAPPARSEPAPPLPADPDPADPRRSANRVPGDVELGGSGGRGRSMGHDPMELSG